MRPEICGPDRRVLEVEPRRLDRGGIRRDRGLRRVGVGLELVELLLRRQVVLHELLVARHLLARVQELRAVPGEIGQRTWSSAA